MDNSAMSQECKEETVKDMNRMATDYRLNYRLNKACEAEVNKLCRNLCSNSGGQTCGGLVLQCLQVRRDVGGQRRQPGARPRPPRFRARGRRRSMRACRVRVSCVRA